ncbi:BCLAF1 and THRAP3 family member 3 isoform X2 [Pseudophryne corroboree]|uniref:BCLAF1 and THRAP3 family member 3 isoform X2 n=1 Tax=Pseudophryne corroboree TaxID=495146 RepID=UPI003081D0C9
MAKSRSRSPRWKPRPLPYRSPEHKRHRRVQDNYPDHDGFHRDPRRPIHWEEDRHGQNNSKTAPYNRLNDKSHELDSFASDLRKSPFDASNRSKRTHSPERRGDGSRRFPAKYPEDPPHRDHNRNVYNHRNHVRNAHNDANGFKSTRREDNFHSPYHREHDRDWHESENQWKHQDHTQRYLPPPRRRSKEFVDRNSFQKRHPEDRDLQEQEQHPKRTRETERLDCRPSLRNSHWKDDSLTPYPDKTWKDDHSLKPYPDKTWKDDHSLKPYPDKTWKDDPSLTPYPDKTWKDDPSLTPYPDKTWKDDHSLTPYPDKTWKDDHSLTPYPDKTWKDDHSLTPYPDKTWKDDHLLTPYPDKTWKDDNSLKPYPDKTWKDDQSLKSYPDKKWSQDTDLRAPSPIVYQTPSGEFTKIEYDYSHRSPSYVKAEPILSSDRSEKRSWHEERKNIPTRTSHQSKLLDIKSKEREKYSERSSEPSTKYSERKGHDRASFKNDFDMRHPNHKHKERGRKEDDFQKEPRSPRHLRNQSPKSPNQKVQSKISPEKETITVNLALKNPTDNYRLPHEHWNTYKEIPSKPEAVEGQKHYEGKQRLGDDMQKRNSATSNDRQMSQDLVAIGGKEDFRPVFEHLEFSKQSGINAPNSEFTQEIITIIHEVKANHFKSAEMSLHERFSKLQAESNKPDLNLNIPAPLSNPKIHRRIDISLEDLHNKSLHKTTEVTPFNQKVIEDPNDLRHDIERRRRQRLHSEEGSATNVDFHESDATGSYYRSQGNEAGEFQKSSRPPLRKPGRPPGWGNPATRI